MLGNTRSTTPYPIKVSKSRNVVGKRRVEVQLRGQEKYRRRFHRKNFNRTRVRTSGPTMSGIPSAARSMTVTPHGAAAKPHVVNLGLEGSIFRCLQDATAEHAQAAHQQV